MPEHSFSLRRRCLGDPVIKVPPAGDGSIITVRRMPIQAPQELL